MEQLEDFTIWIDNDACPVKIREVIFKAAKRTGCRVAIVANSYMHPPAGINVEVFCVGSEFDAADHKIALTANAGDLVITSDVPLADRVVAKGAIAINSYGVLFDPESIKEKLALRHLNTELRSSHEWMSQQKGGRPFSQKEVNKFSTVFDRTLTQLLRKKTEKA